MKRDKSLMTPQELQRTMDFILRSQADAIIRMDRWEERRAEWDVSMESKLERLDERIERISKEVGRVIAAVRESTKLSAKALRTTVEHTKKIQKVEKSTGLVKRRTDSLQGLMKIAVRLLAHQSRRLDTLEQSSSA